MKKLTIQSVKTYVSQQSEILIGLIVVVVSISAIVGIAVIAENVQPKIVYEPAKACELLTLPEAVTILGDKAVPTNNTAPSQSQNVTTSQCGYTDGTPDTETMLVAAVVVRSGINDDGTEQNRSEFSTAKSQIDTQPVNGVGDDAFYNAKLGQLNILSGRNWMILSSGVGSTPQANTLEDSLTLARTVL